MYLKVKVLVTIVLTFNIFLRKGLAQIYEDIDGCLGNLCYRDPTYPYRDIQETWKKEPEELLNTLGTPLMSKNKGRYDSKSRNSCSLCETKFSKKVQLMSILDDNNLKLFIMSTTKYPSPVIHVVTCKQPDAPCSITTQNDIMTRCVQKKTTLNYLTFNATSKEFIARAVSYPSACDCVLLEADPDE